jgi:peptidoglycan/xylan/chitin deacetylase (PgdA/CDA1 family)
LNPESPASAAPPRPVSGTAPPRTLARDAVILMYHHCATPPADAAVRGLYVTPAQFAWQMDWLLNQNGEWCTFADLERPDAAAERLREAQTGAGERLREAQTGAGERLREAQPAAGERLREAQPAGGGRRPRVLVTFDDGFRDVYENAWPVLSRRGIPAVVYPVVGDLGKSGVVWPENTDLRPQSLMSAEQIREMAAGGVEFGSHLWDHRRAGRMGTEDLRSQLARSCSGLAAITGRQTLSLAYPYGDYSPRVVEETARAGYRYAVTTREGTNRDAPVLELRRFAIRGTRFYHRWRFTRTLRRALAAASEA